MSDRSFDIFHPFVSPVREAVGEGVSISTYMSSVTWSATWSKRVGASSKYFLPQARVLRLS
jgi:hypothetical protein